MRLIRLNKIGILFIACIFLAVLIIKFAFAQAFSSYTGYGTVPPKPEFQPNPFAYYQGHIQDYWTGFNEKDCQARQDFLVQILPGSCSPAVVRSDLLEENNVPVFCQLTGVKLNPLIEVPEITSITFKPQNRTLSKDIVNIGFHPARAALKTWGSSLVGSPVLDNLGYLVVILRSQPIEKNMTKWVEADLSAQIQYKAENAFGVGRANFIVPVVSEDEWQQTYQQYSFWKGKGYLRVLEINKDDSGREFATIGIYTDANKQLTSLTLNRGEKSSEIYLPGYYCQAGLTVNLINIDQPKDKALIVFDDDELWVSQGQKIGKDKCSVSRVEPDVLGGGSISISCGGRTYKLEKKLPQARITLMENGKETRKNQESEIGEDVSGKGDILLFIGNTRAARNPELRQENKDFIVIGRIIDNKGASSERLIEDAKKRIKNLMEGKGVFGGASIKSLDGTDKSLQAELGKLAGFGGKMIFAVIPEGGGKEYNDPDKKLTEKPTFVFEGLAGVYEEEYKTEEDAGKLLEEYYQNAENALKEIARNHGTEKEGQKEGIKNGEYYGAKALYTAAQLARELKKFKTYKEILQEIVDKYPDSLLASTASAEIKAIGTNDVKGTSTVVYVGGETHFISLQDIQSAADVKKAKVVYSYMDGNKQQTIEEEDVSEKDTLYLEDKGEIIVERIDDRGVSFTYPSGGIGSFTSSVNVEAGKETIVYLKDKTTLKIFVKEVLMNKEANIGLVPRVERAETEANFTFKIGIEKRAIQLSPKKARGMIDELNKSIAQWETITNNLGKLIESWKATCFVGSAALMVKSFFENMGGGSVGRKRAMDGWKTICKEEIAEAKSQGKDMTYHQCFAKHSAEIEKWTKFYAKSAEDINKIAQECKNAEDVVHTSEYLAFKQYSLNEQKYIEACKDKIAALAKGTFRKEKTISISPELLKDADAREEYKRLYSGMVLKDSSGTARKIEDIIDGGKGGDFILEEEEGKDASKTFSAVNIMRLQQSGYFSSEDAKEVMMLLKTKEECDKSTGEADRAYCETLERRLYEKVKYFDERANNENQKSSYLDELKGDGIKFDAISDEAVKVEKAVSPMLPHVKIPDDRERAKLGGVFGGYAKGNEYYIAPIRMQFGTKEDKEGKTLVESRTDVVVLKLKRVGVGSNGEERYDIVTAAVRDDKIGEYKELSKDELNQLRERITQVSYIPPGKYRNPYKNPEVRYWETGPYKGLPALVPIGKHADDGWYVATKPYVLGTKSFTEAGQSWNFWICNVGANQIEQFEAPEHGDDTPCQDFIMGTGQPSDRLVGLDEQKAKEIIRDAQSAIREAISQYGQKRVQIGPKNFPVGRPAVQGPGMECEDYMSPSDCGILFNLCDPVLCPPSRCDFGGRYPVSDVVQTGIFGSILLCMPNIGTPPEGVMVPVCLTGIHAGLDMYTKTLGMMRDCLQENLKSGKTVGICDQITSVYMCEFWWKQAIPLFKIGIPYAFEFFKGERTRGGGEYMFVQDSWKNAENSIKYFTNYYGVNAMKAFQARSLETAGTDVCRMSMSAAYPNTADYFKKLVEPESPAQFHAEFSESVMTEATVPPTSHYKVSYRIYAGKDQGAYYQIYLRGAPTTEYYQIMQLMQVPNAMGYIPAGEYAAQSIDFTGPTGYKELCIQINGQEKCGFQQVTTSFMFDELKNLYLNEQATAPVTTEVECVGGKPSLMPLTLGTNPQAAIEETIQPTIYKRGVIRICASDDPGLSTEPGRWRNIGFCGSQKIRCWLDTQSINKSISDLGLVEQTIEEAKAREKDINKEGMWTQDDCINNLGELDKAYGTFQTEVEKFFRDSFEKESGKLKLSIRETEDSISRITEPVTGKASGIVRDCPFSHYTAKARFRKAEVYKAITEKLAGKLGIGELGEKERKIQEECNLPDCLDLDAKDDDIITIKPNEKILLRYAGNMFGINAEINGNKADFFIDNNKKGTFSINNKKEFYLVGDRNKNDIIVTLKKVSKAASEWSIERVRKGEAARMADKTKAEPIGSSKLSKEEIIAREKEGYYTTKIYFKEALTKEQALDTSIFKIWDYLGRNTGKYGKVDVTVGEEGSIAFIGKISGVKLGFIEQCKDMDAWGSLKSPIVTSRDGCYSINYLPKISSKKEPYVKTVYNAEKISCHITKRALWWDGCVQCPTRGDCSTYDNNEEECTSSIDPCNIKSDWECKWTDGKCANYKKKTTPSADEKKNLNEAEEYDLNWGNKVSGGIKSDSNVPCDSSTETSETGKVIAPLTGEAVASICPLIAPSYSESEYSKAFQMEKDAKKRSFYPTIKKYAQQQQYSVNFNLIRAIIQSESNWDEDLSEGGMYGLMQLTKYPVDDLKKGTCSKIFGSTSIDRYDTEQNIKGGVMYLSCLIKKFNKNMPLAIAAYNVGPTEIVKNCKQTIESCSSVTKAKAQQYLNKISNAYVGIVSTQSTTSSTGKIIVIDAGHGGSDPGALNPYDNKKNEEDISLDIALRLEAVLESKGYAVTLTRVTDETVSLGKRVEISNNAKGNSKAADLFISIHTNSAGSEGQACTATGTQVAYYRNTKSFTPELAKDIAKSISAATGLRLREYDDAKANIYVRGGVYGAGYHVIGPTNNAPGIYIETAFICNKDDEKLLTSISEQEQIVAAISQALSKYI